MKPETGRAERCPKTAVGARGVTLRCVWANQHEGVCTFHGPTAASTGTPAQHRTWTEVKAEMDAAPSEPGSAEQWPEVESVEFSTPKDAQLAKKLAEEIQNLWRVELAASEATIQRLREEAKRTKDELLEEVRQDPANTLYGVPLNKVSRWVREAREREP